MKKAAVILLALVIVLSAVACVSTGGGNNSSMTVSNSSVPSSDKTDTSSDSSTSQPPSSITDSSDLDSSVAGPSSSHTGSGDEEEIVPQPEPDPDPNPQPKPSIHEEHYCYSKLTPRQKQYYGVMHDAVKNMLPSWVVLGEASGTYKTDVAVVRNALANDHPDIFWLPSYYATAIGTDSAGKPAVMVYFSVSSHSDPSYLMTVSERDRKAAELEKAVKEITDKVTSTDPYEIELQLHDLLCEAVEYSDRTDDPQVYTAYGALVNKSAVCEGYSRAMQLLLSKFGIQAVTVTGTAGGEGHMWNAVNLHGEWYHLDATWNDSTVGAVSHEYFNITDTVISLDHTFNKNYYEFGEGELDSGTLSFNTHRPVCNGTEYNYFNRSGFVFFADGITALTGYITRVEATVVEVKFSDTAFRDRFNNDSDRFVQRINEQLSLDFPDCGFYIGGYSVSASVLRLYKTELVTVDSGQWSDGYRNH